VAHLWFNQEGEPAAMPLSAEAYDLATALPRTIDPAGRYDCGLIRVEQNWVLVSTAAARVRVNGHTLTTRIRVLADRDEVTLGGRRFYYSKEELAAPEAYQGGTLRCPRCKQPVTSGQQVVRCPQCRAIHHQTEKLNCWSYSDTCSLCQQPADLNAGFQWVPEEF
jgi:hypothetical protein